MKPITPLFKLSILLLAFFCIQQFADAQSLMKTRTEVYSFKVKPDCYVQLTNKYGNIHINTWSNDSVKVEVSVIARASSEEKLENIQKYIDFGFTSSLSHVVGRTIFNDYTGSIWSDFARLATSVLSSGNTVEINYMVFIPDNANIKLDNKFGNVYITSHKARFDLKLSNGDLKAQNLTGESEIQIDFGSANISQLNRARLQLNYVELYVASAGSLSVNSKLSKLNIDQVETLDIFSRRDRIRISDIEDISGDAAFTYMTIRNLNHFMKLNTSYGEIRLDQFSGVGTKISVFSEYTDVSLNFSRENSCHLDVSRDFRAQLSFPPGTEEKLKKELVDAAQEVYRFTGTIGKNTSTNNSILISAKSGVLRITQI